MYLLSCRDCPAVYVGKTGRCFAARFCDHLSAFVNGNAPRFAFAEHLIDNNHIPGNEEVLHVEKNFRLRTAVEEIEIGKNTVCEGREYSTGEYVLMRSLRVSSALHHTMSAQT